VKIYKLKSCCGASTTILETDKPLRKSHASFFKEAKYFIPDNFYQAGIFYAQLGTLIITGPYGANKFSIRCSGSKCEEQISSFQSILEKAINS